MSTKEAGSAQTALICAKRLLPEFMVAYGSLESARKSCPQFAQALARTLTCGIVGDTNCSRVARIITILDHEIAATCAADELIEQMIVGKRVALPKIAAIKRDPRSLQRIVNVL